jgi:hypothetical protein
MARPFKPTAVLEVLGSFEHDPQRKRDAEPMAEGKAVKPKYLKGLASRIWEEYAPKLEKMGILYAIDAPALATWCCLEAEFQREQSRMKASRITQKRSYEGLLGMSPGTRSKLGVTNGRNVEADAAEKYLQ